MHIQNVPYLYVECVMNIMYYIKIALYGDVSTNFDCDVFLVIFSVSFNHAQVHTNSKAHQILLMRLIT